MSDSQHQELIHLLSGPPEAKRLDEKKYQKLANDRTVDPLLRRAISHHYLGTKDDPRNEKPETLPLFPNIDDIGATLAEDEIVEDAGCSTTNTTWKERAQVRQDNEMSMVLGTEESRVTVGTSVLALVTSGMYNDPMAIYREYIQNAVDELARIGASNATVKINIDQQGNKVSIRDHGPGLTYEECIRICCHWHRAGNSLEQTEGSGASTTMRLGLCPKSDLHNPSQ